MSERSESPTTATASPRAPSRWRRLATIAAVAYVVLLAFVLIALWVGVDRWWWATVIAFAPRWPWLTPAPIALALCCFAKRGRTLAAATIALAALLVGLRVPLLFGGGSEEGAFTVVSLNTAGGSNDPVQFARVMPTQIDALVMQEGGKEFRQAVIPEGWNVTQSENGLCIASPHPMRDMESHGRPYMPGWGQSALRCVVATPNGPVRVVAVHLRTPRDGFEAVLSHKLGGVPKLRTAIQERLEESRVIRAWIDDWNVDPGAPLIVAGDFNTPIESRVYQRYWSDLRNAFGVAGFGLGTTKTTRWHGIRIDHVLCDLGTSVLSCRVAPGLGGDHRAVIASLAMNTVSKEPR